MLGWDCREKIGGRAEPAEFHGEEDGDCGGGARRESARGRNDEGEIRSRLRRLTDLRSGRWPEPRMSRPVACVDRRPALDGCLPTFLRATRPPDPISSTAIVPSAQNEPPPIPGFGRSANAAAGPDFGPPDDAPTIWPANPLREVPFFLGRAPCRPRPTFRRKRIRPRRLCSSANARFGRGVRPPKPRPPIPTDPVCPSGCGPFARVRAAGRSTTRPASPFSRGGVPIRLRSKWFRGALPARGSPIWRSANRRCERGGRRPSAKSSGGITSPAGASAASGGGRAAGAPTWSRLGGRGCRAGALDRPRPKSDRAHLRPTHGSSAATVRSARGDHRPKRE